MQGKPLAQRSREPSDSDGAVYSGFRLVPEREKLKVVRRYFDTVAPRYDLGNTILSFGLHHLWRRHAVRVLGLKPGDRVIDVCGGTANLAVLAAKAVGASGRVTLCDISRAMMDAGKPKVARSGLGERIDYVQGDAEELCLLDETFDAAMVGFGVRNLTHIDRGFEEIYRVLKPGGRLMCLEFSKATPLWFRWLYDLYSFSIIPLAGRTLLGSWEAYRYLPQSIRTFPLPEQLTALLERIGFSRVTEMKLSNGIAVVHSGTKV